jgi:hypothetical protein
VKGLYVVTVASAAPGVKRLEATIEADTPEEAIYLLRVAMAHGTPVAVEVGP